MRALVASAFITMLVVVIGIFAALSTTSGQEADPPCVVSILNRTAFVQPDFSWQIDNIPSNFGLVRARMTCVQNGQTITGQSDFFQIIPGVITQVDAPIILGEVEPIPESIDITPSSPTLTNANLTVQLTVIATFPDASTKDITLREEGTNYTSSNEAIATVSENGLVSAILSGNVLVSVINEGLVRSIQVAVLLSGDSDGDGIPDDYETANGLNPNDPVDAMEDPDSDGLSTLEEFQRGTDPNNGDTDGDTILDGEEVIPGADGFITNPLLADTDGDQIRDALEISVGTDPNDSSDFDFGLVLVNLDVEPISVGLIVNSVVSQATAQLIVTGTLTDGTTVDLTKKSTGTTYLSSDLLVVNFGIEDGKIFAGQDGSVNITVSNGGFNEIVPVTVSTFTPLALSRTNLPAGGWRYDS